MATNPPFNDQKRRALKQFLQRNNLQSKTAPGSLQSVKNQTAAAYAPGAQKRLQGVKDQTAAQYAPGGQNKPGVPRRRRFSNNTPFAKY